MSSLKAASVMHGLILSSLVTPSAPTSSLLVTSPTPTPPPTSWTARTSETAEKTSKCAVPIAQKSKRRAWMIDPQDLGVCRKGNIAAQVMGTHKVGVHGACSISRASRFSSHLREDPEVREEAGLVEGTEKFRRPDEDHTNYHTLFKNYVGYLPGIWLRAKNGTKMETQTRFVPGGICALALVVTGLVSTGD